MSFIGVFPEKTAPAVKFAKDSLGPEVDLDHCIFREQFTEPASSYIVKSMSTNTRTIVNHNDLPEMTAEEFEIRADVFAKERCWYHFEVRTDCNIMMTS